MWALSYKFHYQCETLIWLCILIGMLCHTFNKYYYAAANLSVTIKRFVNIVHEYA